MKADGEITSEYEISEEEMEQELEEEAMQGDFPTYVDYIIILGNWG